MFSSPGLPHLDTVAIQGIRLAPGSDVDSTVQLPEFILSLQPLNAVSGGGIEISKYKQQLGTAHASGRLCPAVEASGDRGGIRVLSEHRGLRRNLCCSVSYALTLLLFERVRLNIDPRQAISLELLIEPGFLQALPVSWGGGGAAFWLLCHPMEQPTNPIMQA